MVSWVPAIGVVTATALYAAPHAPVYNAVRAGAAAEKLNVMPAAISVFATLAWMQYAFVIADPFLVASNAPGFVLSIAGMSLLLPLLEKDVRLRYVQTALTVGVSVMTVLWIVITFGNAHHDTIRATLGAVGVCCFMLLCVSPLATIRRVVCERDAASIYVPLAVAQVVNCALWVVYGASVANAFVWIPNAVGASLGVVQVMLKCALPTPELSPPPGSSA